MKRNSHQWIALVIAAMCALFAWMLTGCAPTRLPDEMRDAITLTAQEAARDIRTARATSRPEAAFTPLLTGYVKSTRVLCSLAALDAHEGRGAWEWIVGAAGIDSGPSGELDPQTAKDCAEVDR